MIENEGENMKDRKLNENGLTSLCNSKDKFSNETPKNKPALPRIEPVTLPHKANVVTT